MRAMHKGIFPLYIIKKVKIMRKNIIWPYVNNLRRLKASYDVTEEMKAIQWEEKLYSKLLKKWEQKKQCAKAPDCHRKTIFLLYATIILIACYLRLWKYND